MAAPMRSTDFRSIVEPILNESFDGIYDQRADEWSTVFREQNGIPRNYHEEPVLYGFGAAPEMPDGTPVTYQQGGVLFLKRYVYKVYGLAFALTKVLVEDGDHIRIGQVYAKHLAQSLVETKETLAANVLNRAFTAGYNGGDGVPLNSASHPIVSGTFSNLLTTAANLSQTSLEQMLIQIRQAVDNNGNLLSEGASVISRLTSPTAWWVQTDAPEGMKLMMRRALEKTMEGDFETDSMRYKATERYDIGWTDPRAMYGTPGV
ncbi:MAG: hypothetical protein EBR82_28785 [Caulobacteraceae bacterium]|nr:hypothetical protein [Caulobacteraceae bacterium]